MIEQSPRKEWWTSPLPLLVATVTVIVISITLWAKPATNPTAAPAAILDQEIAQIASEVSTLKNEVKIASSAAGQEKILRNELLLQKSDEFIVQIPPLKPIPAMTRQPEKILTHQQKWQNLLLGL